ncbi:MAG TPA: 23S rRNA (adenine(2503)-C(2))-methyltransferase RlmN [Tepidisphaeraceae bacterium]|jgi:23S rRNA (adenine2503-C2)-methyltransferase|nr:23S rRNA (adenine(2503)-C(2))-methyltransferase RlmN [Tepidisphaeraceae bacterium]
MRSTLDTGVRVWQIRNAKRKNRPRDFPIASHYTFTMPALSDFDVPTLADVLSRAGCVPSHARTLLRNYYDNHGHLDFAQLRVGRKVEGLFAGAIAPRQSNITTKSVSADGTTKLLVRFTGGRSTETVLMPGHRADRAAGCVSSQIGCAMGCDFCASTKRGLERSLTAGEIVEQFLHLRAEAALLNRKIASLVFMGMGEPLLNLANVVQAIKLIAGSETGSLGWRQITVSTVGIVPGIDALAAANLNVHLALSLHAPDDATRAKLVPMNRRYPVADILAAARRFYAKTDRIVTIEYCMLAGVNDSDEHASMLVDRVGDFRAHVNLIPYNAIGAGLSGMIYRRPTPDRVLAFLNILRDAKIVAHSRQTRGDDVNAACGQLLNASGSD